MTKTFETVYDSPLVMRGTKPWKWLYRIRPKNSLSALHKTINTCPNPDRKAHGLKLVVYIFPPSFRCVHQILPDGEEDEIPTSFIHLNPASPSLEATFLKCEVWSVKPPSSCLPQKSFTLIFCLLLASNEPFCNVFLSDPLNRLRGKGIHPGHAMYIFWYHTVR